MAFHPQAEKGWGSNLDVGVEQEPGQAASPGLYGVLILEGEKYPRRLGEIDRYRVIFTLVSPASARNYARAQPLHWRIQQRLAAYAVARRAP
ncbi:hypothetical protein EI533_06355 [Pseudomonas donghuensis]|nr:hypothetical protein [Pseudomonas donghuensis]